MANMQSNTCRLKKLIVNPSKLMKINVISDYSDFYRFPWIPLAVPWNPYFDSKKQGQLSQWCALTTWLLWFPLIFIAYYRFSLIFITFDWFALVVIDLQWFYCWFVTSQQTDGQNLSEMFVTLWKGLWLGLVNKLVESFFIFFSSLAIV